MAKIIDPKGLVGLEFVCPRCGGHRFGTSKVENQPRRGYCHGFNNSDHKKCGFTWLRPQEDKNVFHKKEIIKIKIGKCEYKITADDKFMDNGVCIQLLTQKEPRRTWGYTAPVLSRREALRLGKLKRIERPHDYEDGISVFSVEA